MFKKAFRPAFQHAFVAQPSAQSNWWEAGGATGAIAAYAPKSASSYAGSKVNLVNSGTHTLTDYDGIPVNFISDGWDFDTTGAGGVHTALVTDIMPDANTTVICKVKPITLTFVHCVVGCTDGSYQMSIIHYAAGVSNTVTFTHGAAGSDLAPTLSLNTWYTLAMTNQGYRNGVAEGSAGSTTGTGTQVFLIGAFNRADGTQNFGAKDYMSSIAFYNNLLTAGQIAAVGGAMP